MRIEQIPIRSIKVTYNPRKYFDSKGMEELSQSIATKGILVPLKVRPLDGHYDLIYGERRLRAAAQIGLTEVPCLVDDSVDDATAIILKGIENISRGNMHYLEQGAYFKKLLEERIAKLTTQDEVAKVFGIDQTTVSTLVKIWDFTYFETKNYILPLLPGHKEVLPGNNEILPGNIGFKHALLLTKLHHDALKVEEKVKTALPDSEQLASLVLTEFTTKCLALQLALCKQTDDENLSLKKLDKRVDELVKEINDALEQRLTDERSRACRVITTPTETALIYNRDSRLLVNDVNTSLKNVDIIKRRFPPVHLIITSPPYFVGKNFDTDHWDDHLSLLETVIGACAKALAPGGKFAINVADPVIKDSTGNSTETLIMPFIVEYMRKVGMNLMARIIWDKGSYWANAGHAVDIQSPPTEYKVQFNWEYLFVFRKDGKREIPESTNTSSRLSREDWEIYADAVWHIPSVKRNPTLSDAMFPEELVARLVKMYSVKGDIVLDPFSGHGTTAKASLRLNRNAIMYELDTPTWEKQVIEVLSSILDKEVPR